MFTLLQPDLTVAEQARTQTSVAMVTGSISRVGGGVSTAVQGLSAALQARGTPVQILSQHDTHSVQDMHEWDGLDVRLAPIMGPKSFAFSAQNQRAMATLDADLLHLHGLWTGSSLNTQVWSRQKRPTIVSPHGMVDAWALRASSVKKRVFWTLFEARSLGQARCIHALSRAEADAVRALGLKVPVAIIPNGIDLAQADATLPKPLWRAELPEGARVVLFFGRLHPKKGLDLAIRALAAHSAAGPAGSAPLHLVVAGPGPEPYVAELEALVAELGVGHQVGFIGPQYGPDKFAALAAADAFILSSHSEGLPMAVLEAWGFGLLVLMTSACNLEIGIAEGAALEVTTEVDNIAAALGRIATMPAEDLAEIGTRGRALVAREFSWSSVAEKMAALYAWAVDGGTPPDFVEF